MKDRNVMRERCGEIGMACRALFWLSIIYLVLLLGCEVWLALFCPGTNFSLTLTQTPSGMTGTGTLTGSLEAVLFGYEPLKVYFENGILSEAAQAVPKTVFLIGFAERIVLVIVAIGIFWCLRVIFRNIDRSESPFCEKKCQDDLLDWYFSYRLCPCEMSALPGTVSTGRSRRRQCDCSEPGSSGTRIADHQPVLYF